MIEIAIELKSQAEIPSPWSLRLSEPNGFRFVEFVWIKVSNIVGKNTSCLFKFTFVTMGSQFYNASNQACFRSVLVTLFPGVITFLDVASISHSRHINVCFCCCCFC